MFSASVWSKFPARHPLIVTFSVNFLRIILGLQFNICGFDYSWLNSSNALSSLGARCGVTSSESSTPSRTNIPFCQNAIGWNNTKVRTTSLEKKPTDISKVNSVVYFDFLVVFTWEKVKRKCSWKLRYLRVNKNWPKIPQKGWSIFRQKARHQIFKLILPKWRYQNIHYAKHAQLPLLRQS